MLQTCANDSDCVNPGPLWSSYQDGINKPETYDEKKLWGKHSEGVRGGGES